MSDDVAARIAALIPKTLADVIGRRDRGVARLATDEEIDALRGDPDDDGRPKATLTRWRVVALDLTAAGAPVHIILLGGGPDGAWGTSNIAVLGEGAARTENGSLYRLVGAMAEGEPPEEDLVHLCALMNKWGWGRILSVPQWSC